MNGIFPSAAVELYGVQCYFGPHWHIYLELTVLFFTGERSVELQWIETQINLNTPDKCNF